MTPNEKLAARRARWEKTQKDGIWRFAFREGVLKWGFGTAVLSLVLMSVFAEGSLDYIVVVPSAFIAFPIGGFFFGVIMWYALLGLNRLANRVAQRKQSG